MGKALPNPKGDVFVLTEDLLEEGLKASRESKRKRIIMPVQRAQNAHVQRLLNFMQPETYVRPHRHFSDHASESVNLLRGALDVLIYSDTGELLETHELRIDRSTLLDIEPGVWHSMVAKEEDTVVFEVKRGPYDPKTDKEFANWADEEVS